VVATRNRCVILQGLQFSSQLVSIGSGADSVVLANDERDGDGVDALDVVQSSLLITV